VASSLREFHCSQEKPGLDIENGFNDLCSLATSLSQVFIFEDPYGQVYITYGLKGSDEEVIFYEECVEPSSSVESSSSLILRSPSLVLEKFGKSGVFHRMILLDKFDLCITAVLKAITDELIQKHGYKLKGAGPFEFHLGCDFFQDPDGTLCF